MYSIYNSKFEAKQSMCFVLFVLSALLGNLTKHNKDVKHTKLLITTGISVVIVPFFYFSLFFLCRGPVRGGIRVPRLNFKLSYVAIS